MSLRIIRHKKSNVITKGTWSTYSAQYFNLANPIKIVLLGDFKTGKSAIVEKLLNRKSKKRCNDYVPTLGVKFHSKEIIVNRQTVKLEVWDTAGNYRYRHFVLSYLTNCQCFCLVFDMSNRNSFDHLDKWMDDINSKISCKNSSFGLLIGTNSDSSEKEVSDKDIELFAEKHSLKFFPVSFSNDEDVEPIVTYLANQAIYVHK